VQIRVSLLNGIFMSLEGRGGHLSVVSCPSSVFYEFAHKYYEAKKKKSALTQTLLQIQPSLTLQHFTVDPRDISCQVEEFLPGRKEARAPRVLVCPYVRGHITNMNRHNTSFTFVGAFFLWFLCRRLDEVSRFFNGFNPYNSTMGLGSTQFLTEMNTINIPVVKRETGM
jgi:hypothetical protein